jgi:PII-like signaling protein
MQIPRQAAHLRIFLGAADRADGRPLYEEIVVRAREAGLAGATVLRGSMGFGRKSHLHTTKILRFSTDLPIVVEIVDTEAKIEAFLPTLDAYGTSLLVTLEKMTVIRYGEDASGVTDG